MWFSRPGSGGWFDTGVLIGAFLLYAEEKAMRKDVFLLEYTIKDY